jgi:hypothetical protein
LREIKSYVVLKDSLMERPGIKRFYDEWLADFRLDAGHEHSNFDAIATVPAEMARLKHDVAWLIE